MCLAFWLSVWIFLRHLSQSSRHWTRLENQSRKPKKPKPIKTQRSKSQDHPMDDQNQDVETGNFVFGDLEAVENWNRDSKIYQTEVRIRVIWGKICLFDSIQFYSILADFCRFCLSLNQEMHIQSIQVPSVRWCSLLFPHHGLTMNWQSADTSNLHFVHVAQIHLNIIR